MAIDCAMRSEAVSIAVMTTMSASGLRAPWGGANTADVPTRGAASLPLIRTEGSRAESGALGSSARFCATRAVADAAGRDDVPFDLGAPNGFGQLRVGEAHHLDMGLSARPGIRRIPGAG